MKMDDLGVPRFVETPNDGGFRRQMMGFSPGFYGDLMGILLWTSRSVEGSSAANVGFF